MLYRLLGTPAALSSQAAPIQAAASDAGATDPAGAAAAAAAAALQDWMDKASTFEAQARPDQARQAYAQALQIAPDNTAAIVGFITADMAIHTDQAIDDHARRQLQQVVAREPDNQRGLWLLGISDFQQHDYAAAASHWQRLHGLLEAGSPMQHAIADKVNMAQSMAQARPSAEPAR